MLQIWSGRICGVDIHISERRDSGQHSWSRLLSVLCLHKHGKAELAAKGLMPVFSEDIYTAFCHFHELKCKGKVKIVSYRRKCYVLRGLASQVMVKVVILADFPGTREAHFNTGSRPDCRVPGYPSTRCEP